MQHINSLLRNILTWLHYEMENNNSTYTENKAAANEKIY